MPALIRLAAADSTMDVLHALAAEGVEAGTAVVATEQTGGRGSRGRTWSSPPGGLWLSVLFRPPSGAGIELSGLRIGLAVADAIEALHAGLSVRIKWPNDLMVGDRKLGGILCEARWQGGALAWMVAGVGINVSNVVAEDLRGTAAALEEWLPGARAEQVEPEVTRRLRGLTHGAERLHEEELAALTRRDWLRGRRLRTPVTGTAAGISDEGALLVTADGGSTVTVRAGSVELADRSRTP